MKSLESGPKYFLVYLSLIFLLGATVLAAQFNWGVASVIVALLIAGLKAALVLTYFMHLQRRKDLQFLVAGLIVFSVIVLVLSAADYFTRHGVS